MLHIARGLKNLSIQRCKMLSCCLLEGILHLPEIVQATPQDSVSELLITTRGQADGMDTCNNVRLL